MKILAIDSSGTVASVAVTDNGALIGEYSINNNLTHSQTLMPMVSKLLEDLALKPNDIDIFSVAIGPGSFTGLRIGISMIKGMAQALSKPVIGVSTLDGLAMNISLFNDLICPMIDARNDNVYTALYTNSGGQLRLESDYMAVHIEQLIDAIPPEKTVIFLGDGALKYNDMLKNKLQNRFILAENNLLLQRASSIAQVAYSKAIAGNTETFYELKPMYLRASQAERMLEQS